MNNLINYSSSDISRQLAYQAHYGTSFSPDRRADGVINSYIADMAEVEAEFSQWVTSENEADIKTELEYYRKGYITRLNAYLSAQSRTMSTMIAGPSNFPVHQQEKRWATADKRRDEWLEWCKKTLDRMRNTYDPKRLANAPISSDDDNAIEKLQAKIDKAEALQSTMKAANAIIRRKLTDDQKVAELIKLDGVNESTARKLLERGVMGNTGFASFQLTNNNANIKRMKDRIAQLTREQARPETEDKEVNGVTISENRDINRLQLFFPGKPSQQVRDQLKRNGFRWSPKEGAWQRLLNNNAKEAARQIVEGLE